MNFMSCAVTGTPSCQRTPPRKRTVHVRRSGEYRQALASIYQLRVDKLSQQQRWADAAAYAQKLVDLMPGDEQVAAHWRNLSVR